MQTLFGIWVAAQHREGAVDLFGKYYAGQFVGKREWRERELWWRRDAWPRGRNEPAGSRAFRSGRSGWTGG